MNKSIIPLFCSGKLEETTSFYRKHLNFRIALEMPGYAELEQGEGGPKLGFMAPEEGAWQEASGQGLVYCFSVEDADAEHARLEAEGVPILSEPEDKPWGDRAFMASDPNGITLYFGHTIASTVAS